MDELQSEKLNRFADSVDAEVEEKINEILNEAENQKKIIMEKAEDEALVDAYNKIQRAVKETEAKYRRMLATRQQQLRINSLKHREILAEKIFDSVKNKIEEFVNSDKYSEYILSLIDKTDICSAMEIYISNKDEKYTELLKKKFGCCIKTDASIEMGGISVVNTEKGLIIDKTLDSKFEEQIKNFSSRYNFKCEATC